MLSALFATSVALAASGGPDAFGYTFVDSDEPGGPSFSFDDIAATGTRLALASADDDGHETLPVTGFTFPFYGEDRTTFVVATNGGVYFENLGPSDYLSTSNACLPTSNQSVAAFIAGFWDDLNPSNTGDIYYEVKGSPGSDHRLIIQFENVVRYATSTPITMQYRLHESGRIQLAYESVQADPGQATVGIQGDGSTGLEYACDVSSSVGAGLQIDFAAGPDDDDDGYNASSDCNDNDPSVHPGAEEACDGVDTNCDGTVPSDEVDNDLDGVFLCDFDCDDGNIDVFPGAEEVCDGVDNDCDGVLATGEGQDADGDGSPSCEDCDDSDPTVNPLAGNCADTIGAADGYYELGCGCAAAHGRLDLGGVLALVGLLALRRNAPHGHRDE